MRRTMHEYWADVRAQREAITEPYVFVATLPARHGAAGGVLVEVAREDAAKLLVDKTHRLATPDEVAKYRAEEEAMRQANLRQERERRMLVMLQPEAQPAVTPKAKGEK
jgi:hypothetical protein